MAETYGFFDGDTEYGQDELNRYYDNIYRSGISVDESTEKMTLEVTAVLGNIKVAPGFAIIKGFWYYNSSDKTIALQAPSSGSRIDRVVVRLSYSNKRISVEMRMGSASAPPALIRNDTYYELSIAKVTVRSDGNIEITDERTNPSLCGAIRPKNLSEYDTWFQSQQSKGWRNIYIQDEMPSNPETGSIWLQTN